MPRPVDAAAALALALLCVACSPSEPIGGQGCAGGFLPGDLVVSEIFANPTGTDDGKEWFEIYNAGSDEANLGGAQLVTARNDGTGERKHRLGALTLPAGGYLVVGGVENGALPAGVDYGYGDDLGDLRNTNGRIQILCGSVVVDTTDYATVPEEQSRAFTGAQTPDAVANDDDARWCAAAPTPRAANASCTPVNPSMCLDGGVMRQLVPPAAGDLEIVEWMPNPDQVGDPAGEWFEVQVDRDVDLNGVVVASNSDDEQLGSVDCLRVVTGDRLLFARGTANNGGLPAPDFVVAVDLVNSNGTLSLSLDGVVIDDVSWATSGDGVATQVDDAGATCAATATYGLGDKGTPGVANPTCGGAPGDQCNDGGTMRAVVAPAVGDLVISEIMPNPNGTDPAPEWFEVYVARDVDLNGVQVGAALDDLTAIASPDCVEAVAGSYLIFARNTTMAQNGGLPRVDRMITFNLVNSDAGVVLAREDALLDGVTWVESDEGFSLSLSSTKLNPADNDLPASFCAGVGMYGTGGMGTPGAANPACP